jgi:hypothetical protein
MSLPATLNTEVTIWIELCSQGCRRSYRHRPLRCSLPNETSDISICFVISELRQGSCANRNAPPQRILTLRILKFFWVMLSSYLTENATSRLQLVNTVCCKERTEHVTTLCGQFF